MKKLLYANDQSESLATLIKLRIPILVVGLIFGIGISYITSNFEKVLSQNIQIAFFLPFIVYIADAVGTQTETIYARNLKSNNAKFSKYIWKELILGLIVGLIFGFFSSLVILLWIHNFLLAISVGLASCVAIAVAPPVALIVTQSFQNARKDPAVSSGPITTVLQDMLSVLIYGVIATLIIL